MVKESPRSPCVISNSLEILGDRWTLLIIRDLSFFGKHEYKEFLASPEAIATNILADRLKKLVNAGLVNETYHPSTKTRKLYYLTQRGKDLLPILLEIIKWGEKHLPPTEIMQPLFTRINADENAFRKEIMQSLNDWERENIHQQANE